MSSTNWTVYACRLASMILEEAFGPVVKGIGELLMKKGSESLGGIIQGVKMPVKAIQNGLQTLIQHNIVKFKVNLITEESLYEINIDRIFEIQRYPRYYALIEKSIADKIGEDKHDGKVIREIIQQIVQAGQIPQLRLIYICGYERFEKSSSRVKEKQVLDWISEIQSALSDLVKFGWVVALVPPGVGGKGSSKRNEIDKAQVLEPILNPSKLTKKIMEKEKEEDVDLELDSNVLWTINIDMCQTAWRNSLVYSGLEIKLKEIVDTRLIKILIDLGFEKHPWENEGRPIGLSVIRDKIEKLEGGIYTSRRAGEHLEVIVDNSLKIVSKLSTVFGGNFSFNMKTAVTKLFWNTVDRVITEKHGYQAMRIFRLVRDNGFVEQDAINEMGMIPSKEAKHLTYKLVDDGFLVIKEVRKSYAISAPPGKVDHVFYVDEKRAVSCIQRYAHKTMINLKQRSKLEEHKIRILTTKEEKLQKILKNMENKKCTPTQIEEMGELLTPPERNLLKLYELSKSKLVNGILQVDETLFISNLFVFYQTTKPNKASTLPKRSKLYLDA